MTREQIKELILFVIEQVDYDMAKSFDPELCEDPEESEAHLERIIEAVENFLKESD